MNCLKCGNGTKVTFSKLQKGNMTKRIRECKKCKSKFNTFEVPMHGKEVLTKEEFRELIRSR